MLTKGYDIICSDLAPVCPDATQRLFPGYTFLRFDVFDDLLPAQGAFDAAVSLSFIYLLNLEQLDRFFRRVKALLKPGGLLIVDPGGAGHLIVVGCLDSVILPVEIRLWVLVRSLQRLTRRRRSLKGYRKHHGYRFKDEEIVSVAERAGFAVEARQLMDFETELNRSLLYRRWMSRIQLGRSIGGLIGRRMPYVRMFAFRSC